MIIKKFEIVSTEFQEGWNECFKKNKENPFICIRECDPDSLEDQQYILGYKLCKKLLKENKQ